MTTACLCSDLKNVLEGLVGWNLFISDLYICKYTQVGSTGLLNTSLFRTIKANLIHSQSNCFWPTGTYLFLYHLCLATNFTTGYLVTPFPFCINCFYPALLLIHPVSWGSCSSCDQFKSFLTSFSPDLNSSFNYLFSHLITNYIVGCCQMSQCSGQSPVIEIDHQEYD